MRQGRGAGIGVGGRTLEGEIGAVGEGDVPCGLATGCCILADGAVPDRRSVAADADRLGGGGGTSFAVSEGSVDREQGAPFEVVADGPLIIAARLADPPGERDVASAGEDAGGVVTDDLLVGDEVGAESENAAVIDRDL